jgi:hypothetical protein
MIQMLLMFFISSSMMPGVLDIVVLLSQCLQAHAPHLFLHQMAGLEILQHHSLSILQSPGISAARPLPSVCGLRPRSLSLLLALVLALQDSLVRPKR